MRGSKAYLWLFVKGMAMGGADVIPGVSGGTIAFITGIYKELLDSIKAVDKAALMLLLKMDIKGFWQKINGGFLLAILSGVAVSVISLAKLLNYLLTTYPIPVWSFFFGLIIISALIVVREVKKWNAGPILGVVIGIGVAYWITVATPSTTPETYWFVFLAGSIAICAMILPGVSGAFILLILGKYEFITTALHEFNIPVILVFILGCLTGILSFVRVVSFVFDKYHNVTVAVLSGFMLGSLNKVWPWKQVVSYRLDSKGMQVPAFDKSVSPMEYADLTGNNPQLLWAVVFFALGILIVFGLEKIASIQKK